MSRWMIRQEFGEYLREHSWIWKAPFLATTAMVWAGAIVVSLGLWQGDSGPPSRARTLPPPASVEVEDTTEDRASLRAESPASGLTDDEAGRSDPAVDDELGGAAETTEVGSVPPTTDASAAATILDVPVANETVEEPVGRPPRSSSNPTPAPPTVTSTAPPTVTAPPPRPPTVTVVLPTTRPTTVTIPRPTIPTTTQPTTVPTTVPATTAPPTSAAPAPLLP